jgi:transcriptional antiterminator NusG
MDLFGDEKEKVEKKDDEEKKAEEKFELKLEGEDLKRALISGEITHYMLKLSNLGTKEDAVAFRVNMIYSTEKTDESPEWTVIIHGIGSEDWDVTYTKETEREFKIDSGAVKDIDVEVTAPKGARYGDQLNLMVTALSKKDPAASETLTLSSTARQTIKAVKTSIGHEQTVADSISSKAKVRNVGVFSIFAPANIRGYVFVETMNPDRLDEIVRGVRRAKGVVDGDTKIGEIVHFLTPKPVVSGMMEAVVPIPVTVRGDSVRVLKKEKED